ncbi:MAG: SDR family NAD(P)-dependent oxidoreductase [Myxococcales bacterium]|nr:SDR family NAD(P)-dependent oxidoreductase [Myxococcales bacterium]
MVDKVAFITGGASGIGAAFAKELGRRGVEVVLADRQIGLAEEIAAVIRQGGGQATAVELDVRDAAQFEQVVDDTVARAGRIDYLFNNAGIAVGGAILGYTLPDWYDVFDVNLRGVAHGIQVVYPVMCRQGSGHIINTASVAGLLPTGEAASYAATKHAVVGLSKALRIEAKEHGVKVSALCPGAIRTPILTSGKYGRLNLKEGAETKVMELWERVWPMNVDVFARKALRDIERNKPIVIVPSFWKTVWWLERFSPSLSLWFWGKLYGQFREELEPYRSL